jgi:hypothetical protein
LTIYHTKHAQVKEAGETPVNNPTPSEQHIGLKTPSSIETPEQDKPIPIRDWQQRYERHLILIGRQSTRERYARALERFLGKYPAKTYGHQFLRPVINQYVETRLAEGASVATVRLEMSAVRGLFQFMLDMGAVDAMFNPAKGVRVKVGQSKSRSLEAPRRDGQPCSQCLSEETVGETEAI